MTNPHERPLSRFISKADTLRTLSGLLRRSSVADLHSFTQQAWTQDREAVIVDVQDRFQGRTIIVRSSALSEDTAHSSNAGSFRSILGVNSADSESVKASIEDVIESYREKDAEDPHNPILVQAQTLDAVSSGTILTRDYNNGSPYYVVNYSGEDTTSVTSGRNSKTAKILRAEGVDVPVEFSGLIDAVQEIEGLAPSDMPLDIEFGIKSTGDIVTFQVRPLVAAAEMPFADDKIIERVGELKDQFKALIQRRPHLAGEATLFGDMPDWNPAEIIGNSPHLLAATLYDEIITDNVWHQARTSQGYTDVDPAQLVVQFGNKPYVDVRNTFNSFVPASINPELREKLLEFYLDKLRANPQLQDKVEFDILHTCYDLSFNRRAQELLETGFYPEEVFEVRTSLLNLTNNLLNVDTVTADIQQNEALESYRQNLPTLEEDSSPAEFVERAVDLLDACKESGTLQFSRLARLGFIGKILLKSLTAEGVITDENYHNFLESITTVASNFGHDIDLLSEGELSKDAFLKKYGHLRPGTYDITTPRYDMSDDYFGTQSNSGHEEPIVGTNFELNPSQHERISEVLEQHGLTINSQQLFEFVRAALEAREYSKFLFSNSLSDAIEAVASAGRVLGFSRAEMSHLDIHTIKDSRGKDAGVIQSEWRNRIAKNKSDYELNSYISLPPVIFSEKDLEVVTYYESRPNYITKKKLIGDIVLLSGQTQEDITGRVVVIESADPGYDWVFAKKPAALITKYGGPASHMAIRCAELGLPAIIGAGEMLYESLLHMPSVIIDCENQRVEPSKTVN